MNFETQLNRFVAAIFGTSCLVLGVPTASAHPCPELTTPPADTEGNTVIQEFPPGEAMQTAWKVRFAHARGKGLYVTGAWFKRASNEPWMQVLAEARIADIFVPYHSGDPSYRYYDLTDYNFDLVKAIDEDKGHCGQIIDGRVIHQVRSPGVLWKDDESVRHAYELVLWATLDSANYNYVMSYGFRDDGTIALRIGATSRNLPNKEYEGHMHNALWRIDVDLNGRNANSVYEVTHNETTDELKATDRVVPFNEGREGGIEWNAHQFSELRVIGPKKNKRGRRISYDLRPVRRGTPRHKEGFTHSDFWVTRHSDTEREDLYELVHSYVNGGSVMDTDIVIWHVSPIHHDPRDEDGYFVRPGVWRGVALLMWSGIDLRPRNLFDRTPLFP